MIFLWASSSCRKTHQMVLTYWLILIPHTAAVHTEALRRSPPLFATAMWNVYQVTLDGQQRTNNLCEAWNCPLEHMCRVSHPWVWKLLHWLKADSAQVNTTPLIASRCELPRRRVKRVYVRLQARLHQLCVDRSEGTKTVEEFLRGAGHNIRWKPHANQVNE